MKKMLLVSPCFPFPPIGGERLRLYLLLRYLSSRWQIKLICLRQQRHSYFPQKEYNHAIESYYLPRWRSYMNCLMGLLNPAVPLQIFYFRSAEMAEAVKRELKKERYDIIFCHLLRSAEYVKDIKGIRKVLDLTDALSLRYKLAWRMQVGLPRLVEYIEARRMHNYEPYICEYFDLNIVSSYRDKVYLEKRGARNLCVIANSVSAVESFVEYQPTKIVFWGNLRTFHNCDAVRYFVKDIFPLVKREIPEAVFCIVGAHIPKEFFFYAKKDRAVKIYPSPVNLMSVVRDAAVAVAPLRVAVGIQNKIIQAMAWGVPVVTTSTGLGDIPAQNERDILVADDKDSFALGVVRLMKDASLRQKIVESAWQLAKKIYNEEEIANRLNAELEKVLVGYVSR